MSALPSGFLRFPSYHLPLCAVDFYFAVKCLNSYLISFCVYSIALFFVVTMGITCNGLRLLHSNLDLDQLNFNNTQELDSATPPPPCFSQWLMSQNYTFMHCVPKYTQIILKGIGLLGQVKNKMGEGGHQSGTMLMWRCFPLGDLLDATLGSLCSIVLSVSRWVMDPLLMF